MHRRLVLAVLAGAVVATGTALAQRDARPGVAVFPFDNGGSIGQDAETFQAYRLGLAQTLITEFKLSHNYRVVERKALANILSEQDLGASGRVDAATAARVGKIVGARYVILGQFMDFSGDFVLDGRVVDVETSEIISVGRVRDERKKLLDLVSQLAAKLADGADLPNLPQERSQSKPSEEAVNLYFRGILAADHGDRAKAEQLFRSALKEFPGYTAAQDELRQLGSS